MSDTCSFANCHRRRKSHGLCNGHNEQRRFGKPLTAIVPRRGKNESLSRDDQGRKWCGQCENWLSVANFSASGPRVDGLYFHCKPCERDIQLRLRYGRSTAEFNAILDKQGGRCAICRTDTPGGHGWCVDHDHSCCNGRRGCGSCVRGALCPQCNSGMGLLGESPANLLAAAIFLLNYSIWKEYA